MCILPFYFGFILNNSTVNCYVVLLVSALKVCSVLVGPGTDSDLKNQNCFYMYHNCIMHNLKKGIWCVQKGRILCPDGSKAKSFSLFFIVNS